MEIYIGKITAWTITIALLTTSSLFQISDADYSGEKSIAYTRSETYICNEGGEWYDDLTDNSMIESTSGIASDNDGYFISEQNETIHFTEDYESYTNGQDLFGMNGWIADTNRELSSSSHQYTATTSGPTPMPSSIVSKVYNPSSGYSYILSKKLSLTSGTVSFGFSTNLMSSSAPSGMLSLMKSQSAIPSQDDRVVGLMIKGGGVYYRTTPTTASQEIIGSGIVINAWYRFEVRFDCSLDKASIYIFDAEGKFMGMAENIDFISAASSIGRIELFTSRDLSGSYVATYWDDIKISPPTTQIYTGGAKFSENFESYNNGQSLFNVNGWVEDKDRSLATSIHQFTATTAPPPSALSPTVGKVYNPDTRYSFILSQRMDIRSGILTCWYATDTVSPSDASGMISLMKSKSSTPSDNDRVLGLLIRDGGVNYRTTPTASSKVIISSGIRPNTWYRFEIHFNCTTDKASIYIYERDGGFMGAAVGIDLISNADFIGRVELFTNRDSSGSFVTNFWDNIEVWGLTGERSLTSRVISKPPGMRWTTLRIDKVETFNNGISLEIIDEYEMPINGLIYNAASDEVDLSPLNGFGVEKVRLRGVLSGTPEDSPVLKGWGVEWNSSASWRDSYTTSLKTSVMTNTEINDRSLVLSPGQTSGTMVTETIELPSGYYWTDMKADLVTGGDHTVLLDVLDAETDDVITGMGDLTGDGAQIFDILSIEPLEYQKIKIKAKLDTTGTGSPSLGSLSVSWRLNQAPLIVDLRTEGEIYRTEKLLVAFSVEDPDQDAESLEVFLEHRSEPSGSWGNDLFSVPFFNQTSEEWQSDFIPTASTPVGNYSFRVTVTDRLQHSVSALFINRTRVLNNEPTMPVIELGPLDPGTLDDIEALLIDNGTDVESGSLLYDYFWYVNDVWIAEETEYNLTSNEISVLPATYTVKHDTVRCIVRSYDLLDHSAFYSVSAEIANSEPEKLFNIPDSIMMKEDEVYHDLNLSHFFLDIDGDPMIFDHLGAENVGFYIMENGSVLIIPPENWTGSENVTITACDGEITIEHNITILVDPVNDGPEFISFTSDRTNGYTGDEFIFTVEAIDIDNEVLQYRWSVNGVAIPHGTPSISLNWTIDYWTTEEWMDKKNIKNATVSVIISDGEIEIGPYEKVVNITLKDKEVYNAAPVIVSISTSSFEIFENGFVIVEVEVTDADGDSLTIFWTHGSDPLFNMSGASINISGLQPGTYVLNVTILDGRNMVTGSVTVRVLDNPKDKDKGIPLGLIMIAVLAVVVFVIVFIAIIWILMFRKKDVKNGADVTIPEQSEEVTSTSEGRVGGVIMGTLEGAGPSTKEREGVETQQSQETMIPSEQTLPASSSQTTNEQQNQDDRTTPSPLQLSQHEAREGGGPTNTNPAQPQP